MSEPTAEWRVKLFPSGLVGTGWILERTIDGEWKWVAESAGLNEESAIASAKAEHLRILRREDERFYKTLYLDADEYVRKNTSDLK